MGVQGSGVQGGWPETVKRQREGNADSQLCPAALSLALGSQRQATVFPTVRVSPPTFLHTQGLHQGRF